MTDRRKSIPPASASQGRQAISAALLAATIGLAAAGACLANTEDSLNGLKLCNYPQCIEGNRDFVETMRQTEGQSVELDVLFDVPIGTGEYNARCVDSNVWLYGPEEFFFVPTDLQTCNTEAGIVFHLSPENYMVEEAASFTRTIRIRGVYDAGLEEPGGIYFLSPAE